MISTSNVFAEFVTGLGEDFIIDVINEQGVAFYHQGRRDLKFSIVTPPMWGLPAGYAGFMVTKDSYPYKDDRFRFEDPQLLEKIKDRIDIWLSDDYPDLPETDAYLGDFTKCVERPRPSRV